MNRTLIMVLASLSFATSAVANVLPTATSFIMAQGQRGGMRGGAGQGMYGLLQRSDVKKDLNLTDDQKTKLGVASDDMRSKMQQAFQDAGGDRSKMQDIMKKMTDEMATSVKGILTPEQQTRLKQIYIQTSGNAAITDPDVAKDLNLTSDQQSKIKALQEGQAKANQDIFAKMQSGELDRSAIRPLMEKNQQTMKDELGKILTDAQKTKLTAMGGAPFKADPDPVQG